MAELNPSEITVQIGELYLDEVNLILGYLRKGSHEQVEGIVNKLRAIVLPQLEQYKQDDEASPTE
jgi:hypothetical protein